MTIALTAERWVCAVLLLLAVAVIAVRSWNGGRSIRGLLASKTDGVRWTPERVPLLIATLGIAVWFCAQMLRSWGRTLPDVPVWALWVFAASCAVYAWGKAVRTSQRKTVEEIER